MWLRQQQMQQGEAATEDDKMAADAAEGDEMAAEIAADAVEDDDMRVQFIYCHLSKSYNNY